MTLPLEVFETLLKWYLTQRENYFFRQNRTPYKVWISEVVLQQTRMQAALEPLERFLRQFPTLQQLHQASLENVLHAFRGLGYYNRAKNLKKGADYLVEHFQGQFPSTYEELRKIPSIGPYTASAIASICFAQPLPAIDGNLKRILSRLLRLNLPPNKLEKPARQILTPLYQQSQHHPGHLNEAFMELGQKICTPKQPLCLFCPLQNYCQSHQTNTVAQYPPQTKTKKKVPVQWQLFLLTCNQHILLQKWKDFYFLKNHWGFPSKLHFPTNTKPNLLSWNNLNQYLHLARPLGTFRHTITHHEISAIVLHLPLERTPPLTPDLQWVPLPNVEKHITASAVKKAWNLYQTKTLANSIPSERKKNP
ncbi:MAG: A/G-specific adenine glycosylase [Planctomycetota bacterium]|nr:MAG: A/G-specific adenine glycosylase [Planctomycetota bacterium]